MIREKYSASRDVHKKNPTRHARRRLVPLLSAVVHGAPLLGILRTCGYAPVGLHYGVLALSQRPCQESEDSSVAVQRVGIDATEIGICFNKLIEDRAG